MTPLEVALAVGKAFESIGVEYFLGGSMASSFQGQPRLTNDLDFVVLLRVSDLAPLKGALGPDFEVDEEALTDAIQRRGRWNIFHLPTVTRIDLFLLKDGEYDTEEFLRKRAFESRQDGTSSSSRRKTRSCGSCSGSVPEGNRAVSNSAMWWRCFASRALR